MVRLKSCGWVFKEVGIETVFDKLMISGGPDSDEKIEKMDEDQIISAMNTTGREEEEEHPRAGMITVTVKRVVLQNFYQDEGASLYHREVAPDGSTPNLPNDVSHTAVFVSNAPLRTP